MAGTEDICERSVSGCLSPIILLFLAGRGRHEAELEWCDG